ncbi:Putative DNA-directed RNA polymerase III, subunit Rpc31 [Septoria linicola]|uniref:DNA-directed RNA polymerase III subunit n=1 Tax=Septoria linicola TaxID=215465 RepID=A0A9Q9B0P8_9PEZI|nr:Putative DNA-directed RNA polymerase III, subunit Rpc31 [Septoria linicola]
MSRGGRGGFGGGASRVGVVGGKDFEIGADLEDQVNAYQNDIGESEEDFLKSIFPHVQTILAPPPTEREKKQVAAFRAHRTAMRNGPLFMDAPSTGKRDAAEFNAFEDVPTYGNKRVKKAGGMPNLKKLPIVKSLLPRELMDLVSDDEEDETNEAAPKKNLNFLKKKKIDKLARFDDDADEGADKDDDDELKENEDGGEDEVEELVDDEFSEDDDDLGNDYNAEQYFDNGDDMEDEGDGEGAGEEAW